MPAVNEAKNAVCSFFGQAKVYDPDLKKHLSQELYALAEEHDAVEFLFHGQSSFAVQCFTAALMTKQHFPDKKITLSIVQTKEEQTLLSAQQARKNYDILYHFADRFFTPSIPRTNHLRTNRRRLSRWIMQQSTHLIYYLYRELDEISDAEYQAIKRTDAVLLDVTCAETSNFLSEKIQHLPPQDQTILQKRLSGEGKKQIGAQLGLSTSLVNRAFFRSSVSLRKSLCERLCAQRQKNASRGPVCSIFSIGPVTYESLCLFHLAISFLVRRCSVSKFLVAAEYCDSAYMYLLKQNDSEITVLPSKPGWSGPSPSLFPLPYQTGVWEESHAADSFHLAKTFLDQSDFCICDLSQNPQAERIKNYLTKMDDIMVLDLGQAAPLPVHDSPRPTETGNNGSLPL